MIINHNLSALNTQRVQGLNEMSSVKGMERLSSGERINRASDDAAGLAISEKMRAQVAGLNQASRNIQDGISFIQATEGYLVETTSILQRLRLLSVQSANGIYQEADRSQIQVEVSQLVDEIDRIADQAEFNGMKLLDGTFSGNVQQAAAAAAGAADAGAAAQQAAPNPNGGPLTIHMGANTDQFETVSIGTMTGASLGISTEQIDLSSMEGANSAIAQVDKALNIVNKQRADLGSYQNRLVEARNGVDIAAENLQAAESRIRDANMSTQVVNFTRDQIKAQASMAMLVQANQNPTRVLQLLQ